MLLSGGLDKAARTDRGCDRAMRFAVAHVINSPAGAVKTARLVINDVPEKTTVAEVLAELVSAGKDAEFAEGGVPFGNHEVISDHARGRSGWPKGLQGVDSAPTLAWSRLTTPPQRNDGRRVTLRLLPAEHAALTLAAQRSGASLQEWCMRELIAAAAREGAQLAAAPAGGAS